MPISINNSSFNVNVPREAFSEAHKVLLMCAEGAKANAELLSNVVKALKDGPSPQITGVRINDPAGLRISDEGAQWGIGGGNAQGYAAGTGYQGNVFHSTNPPSTPPPPPSVDPDLNDDIEL